MAKKTFPVATTTDYLSTFNDNFVQVAAEMQDKLLYRDNPDGEPNDMQSDLDMNSNRIYNLPTPVLMSEAARLQDVVNATAGIPPASAIPFTPSGTISSNNVQAAINELDVESAAAFTYLSDYVSATEAPWTAYSPIILPTVGSFIDVSVSGRYKRLGKTVFFQIQAQVTDNGTGSGFVTVTLPSPSLLASNYVGVVSAGSLKSVFAYSLASSNLATIFTGLGTYPVINGDTMLLSGTYEEV